MTTTLSGSTDEAGATGEAPGLRRRFLPHPLLTLVLTVVWMLLLNDLSMGGLVLGLVLGVLIPLFTSRFWPEIPKVKSYVGVVEYILIVLWDIVVANIQVSYLILFKRNDELRPRFIAIPLEIRTPEAISTLAGTITMTPGTVSSDLAADGRTLLVHCLNTEDEAATVAAIKARYESRLLEIFG